MRIQVRIGTSVVAGTILSLVIGLAYGIGGGPVQTAKLLAADAATGDRFGESVAIAGDTAVVGASHRNSSQGAAYVLVRTGTVWSQQAMLTASNAANGDEFGYAVAIDGDTAVVGAHYQDSRRGAAYVFTRSGTTWTQEAVLLAAGVADGGDEFGYSVAISGDTVVVGAPWRSPTSGGAYVFTRTGATWTQQAQLASEDPTSGDTFGVSVAVSGDSALIGAANKNSNQGAAYVLTRTGTTWTQQAKLAPADAGSSDEFGYAVALAGDTAVAGAYFKDAAQGAAYVFKRTGTAWAQQSKLTAADEAPNRAFGIAVAAEGDTAIVGADINNGGTSAAYVYTRTGNVWTQRARLGTADAVHSDFFGAAVAVSGGVALVGAFYRNQERGAAFVYDLSPSGGPPPGYFFPTNVKAKAIVAHPEKSTLVASGTLDTGPGVADFSGAATFDVGGFRLSVPGFTPKRGTLVYGAGGITLTITPAKNGSSRAKFAVKVARAFGESVQLDGPLAFNFTNAAHNLSGTATLVSGKLAPRAVTAPDLSVLSAAATIKGGGKDSLTLTVGFATDGVVPGTPEPLTISFGGTFTATLAADTFLLRGARYVRAATPPGITKAIVDYAKGTITVTGSRLDLGAFAAGGNPVAVTITRGADTRTVRVRMSLAGTKLAY